MFRHESPESKIRKAVSSLIAVQRFFGTLALRMRFAPGNVETLAGDGIEFTYNPEWISEALFDQIKGSIAHIVVACSLHHQFRRGSRDYETWQKASRLATAPILEGANLWVPEGVTGPFAKQYADLPVEVIYDRLEKEKNQQGEQNQAAGGMQPPSSGLGGASNSPTPSDQPPPPLKQPPGEIQDAPGDAQERSEQEQKWDKATKQAIQASKSTGSDPGNIEQLFDDQHISQRDWRDLLREYMRATAPTDYSWSRPNRRYIDSGLYLPSLHGEGMGPLVVAIDTSGSVDDEMVKQFLGEVFEISTEINPERMHIVQCDLRVTSHLQFDAGDTPDPSEIAIKGRGGTSFQPVFDYIEDQGIEPDVLVYMTDTYGPAPEEPPFPVIWAVESAEQLDNVPFGTSVILPMDEEAA